MRNALVLWHLLSLDAPTVAVTWTCFVAAVNGVRLSGSSIAATAISVWLLYAADRLLDARGLLSSTSPTRAGKLEARHLFHHRHRSLFKATIAAAVCVQAGLLVRLPAPDLRLYLIEGCFLSCYLAYVHATRTSEPKAPKELAVGLFFAAATFIPTIAQHPELRLGLLPPAILLSALCSLNGLFIYAWEHPREADRRHEHSSITRLAAGQLALLAVVLLVVSLWMGLSGSAAPRRLAAAVLLSICLLLSLHACRRRMSIVTLRAAADAALLTPLLLLPLSWRIA